MNRKVKIASQIQEGEKEKNGSVRAPAAADRRMPSGHPLGLQSTLGNQAVQRLLKAGVLQAKLSVGQPGDIAEQEADRVAHKVMTMPDPGLQRQQPGEEEEKLQTSPLSKAIAARVQRQAPEEEEEKHLQAKENDSSTPEIDSSLESDISGIRGGGTALPDTARAYFEPRFGCDFSQVRVHSNMQAASMAEAVNAKAFTIGRDVVFNSGQYSPGTSDGNRLLAHELTHVVQQGATPSASAAPEKED